MTVRKEFVLYLCDHYDMEEARETLASLSRDPDPEIRSFVLKFMQAQKAGKFRPIPRTGTINGTPERPPEDAAESD